MAASSDVPNLYRMIVQVSDATAAATFYETLLGIEGRAVGGGRRYFDCGPVILAVLDPSSGGDPAHATPDYIYFSVRDLESVHARAASLRCLSKEDVHGDPAGDIAERPWGERSFYATDPWGNKLCFVDATTVFTGRGTAP